MPQESNEGEKTCEIILHGTNDSEHVHHATENQHTNQLRRSERVKKPPSYLKDFYCALNSSVESASSSPTNLISQTGSLNSTILPHTTFALAASMHNEPKTYAEAVVDSNWKEAIDNELSALEQNKTWTLTQLPIGKKTVGCKWVFKLKLHPDGSIERYKARLVAQGFSQTQGVDYKDIFSPVVKMTTFRMVVSVAAVKGWHLHQLGVNTAFLHGDLNEIVYMKPPPGLHLPEPGLICKLDHSLYGLKQASRQWNLKLANSLIDIGYTQCKHDYNMFTKQSSTGFTVLLVYIDDLVLAGNNLAEINHVKRHLHDLYKIKDLGELKYFLGMEVSRSKRAIAICQRKYCLDLLKDYGMDNAKPASTPMEYTTPLSKNSGTPLSSNSEYRRIIGRLLYLTNTKPEICYAVGKLSQFLDCATDKHFEAALRVLRYLKGVPAKGLFFSAATDLTLSGFSDSDWGTCPDSRKSITGYCFFLGTYIVSWKSKKTEHGCILFL
ncbi:hypothetical protein PIB30_117115 [Stylosanthes scabra]|uniref:Reverse transcriptase Ty1/copia-type domain-containing protein n=1 Tax=Stylosanthes scabra TaxID=79078 RepID=A0ABU6S5X2_9FABA|nr:hypothetical protein [Stylosanthes scabra]